VRINNSFFGFCCLAFPDGHYEGTKFKSTTLSWCRKNPRAEVESKLIEIYKHNLREYQKVLSYCATRDIFVYRVSSSMFPLADHPEFEQIYNHVLVSQEMAAAKIATARYLTLGGRLSTHPGQFVSISSETPRIVSNSLHSLEFHARFMSDLGIPEDYSSPINIHVSNGSKNPVASSLIVQSAFGRMSKRLIRRLVFENEDSGCWTVTNLKTHFPNVPIVFDSLHYLCNPDRVLAFSDAFHMARSTWINVGHPQMVHHSEGKNGETDRRHSDFVTQIPKEFKNYPVICEIEAKKKNLAVINLGNPKVAQNI
jgi:UV DNA damage endonuclease